VSKNCLIYVKIHSPYCELKRFNLPVAYLCVTIRNQGLRMQANVSHSEKNCSAELTMFLRSSRRWLMPRQLSTARISVTSQQLLHSGELRGGTGRPPSCLSEQQAATRPKCTKFRKYAQNWRRRWVLPSWLSDKQNHSASGSPPRNLRFVGPCSLVPIKSSSSAPRCLAIAPQFAPFQNARSAAAPSVIRSLCYVYVSNSTQREL